MFEKEAEAYATQFNFYKQVFAKKNFLAGAEFGYNKAKEDVKHGLMMKLKDEGIVKVLKDSIFCNKKLSSQEQQELCAWIECAMDFGENLDECAKELEETKKDNEWHYVKDGDLPKEDLRPRTLGYYLTALRHKSYKGFVFEVAYFTGVVFTKEGQICDNVIAWKEIILPEVPKESE